MGTKVVWSVPKSTCAVEIIPGPAAKSADGRSGVHAVSSGCTDTRLAPVIIATRDIRVDFLSAHLRQPRYQLVAEAPDEPDGIWIAGKRTGMDQVDAQLDVVLDGFQVFVEILEGVDK